MLINVDRIRQTCSAAQLVPSSKGADSRADAFVFPSDLKEGKSPTFNVLMTVVAELMERRMLRPDDVAETALSIWAHAHGLITLYLSGRIAVPREPFQKLYMRSLDRLLHGIAATA
jgi:hypothetical protein